MPEVSVVIPTYNAEFFISDTINSVLNQTYKDFEIILVDDGSTDNTDRIVAQQHAGKVKYIRQKNSGVSSARNKAISMTKGDFIAFIDCDDIWLENKLEAQVSILKKSKELGLVFSNAYILDEKGRRLKDFFKIVRPHSGMVFNKLVQDNFIPMLTAVVKREALDRVGLFDPRYKIAEDWDIFLRIARVYPVTYINQPLAEYRIHKYSHSKNRKLMLRECIDILNKYINSVNEEIRLKLKGRLSLYNSMLGIIYFKEKEILKARSHFLSSLENYPINLRSYLGLINTFLPKPLSNFFINFLYNKSMHE